MDSLGAEEAQGEGDAQRLCVVLLGDAAVGKTQLIARSASRVDQQEGRKRMRVGERAYELELLDSREDAVARASVILLVFSCISPASLASCSARWARALEGASAPLILVCNKVDLREDARLVERLAQRGMRPVSRKEGERVAQLIGALDYMETSCGEDDPLAAVFSKGIELVFGGGKKERSRRDRNCAVY